jgi:outer membrane lipoprotein-sorting protein
MKMVLLVRWLLPIFTVSVISGMTLGAERNLPSASTSKIVTPLKLAKFETLSGQFSQSKYVKDLDVTLNTQGNFRIRRLLAGGSVVHWNVQKPKASSICIDEKGVVLGNQQLNFSDISSGDVGPLGGLLKLMTLDPDQIHSEFKVEKEVQKKVQKKEVFFVLTQLHPNLAFFEYAKIQLDRRGLLKKLVLHEKSQDEMTISFSGLKTTASGNSDKENRCER